MRDRRAAVPIMSAFDLHTSDPAEPLGPPQHLWSAFEHAVIGMTLISPDNRPLRINRAFCEFVGYALDELLGMTLLDLVHPDDVEEERRQRALLLAGHKESYRREKRYFHKDGRLLWGDFSATLVRDAQGRPLHYVAQVQDITQRKKAEQDLHDAQSVVGIAVQIGRLGAWSYEPAGGQLTCSDELCAIFEARPPFAPGAREALEFFAGDCRRRMRETLRKCLADGSPFDVEAQVITVQGRRIWTRVICEAEWDAHGRVCRLHGAVQDISESRQTQQALQESQRALAQLNASLEERVQQRTEQLQQANAELESFAYSIAHDLRAPMTSLAGFSRLLEQNLAGLDARNGHYLRRIQGNVHQMSDLTDALLALARLSAVDVAHQPVDLAALARQVLDQLRELEPGRALVADIAPALPAAGDPRLLQQVMANLMSNAWKFSRHKPCTRITVGSQRGAQGESVFFVADEGVGFDMEHAGALFGAFRRLHSSTEFEGTGIGLALVRKIIARHGGRIWAQAEPGQGATIFFTLGEPPQPHG